jgi:hypothetical protein
MFRKSQTENQRPAPPPPISSDPVSGQRINLNVPFAEKDAAKAAGARWDPNARTWYVEVQAGENADAFARWLPPPPARLRGGPTVEVGLVAVQENCYRCGIRNRPVVAITLPASGADAIFYEEVGEALSILLSEQLQAALPTGPIALRSSRTRPEPYWSNGCRQCGAIFGSFPLWETFCEIEDPSEFVVATVSMPVAYLADETRC